MKALIALLLFITFSNASLAASEEEPVMIHEPEISARTKRMAAKYEAEIKAGKFENNVQMGLDALIRLAVYKLKREGYVKESKQLWKEWQEQYQFHYEDLLNDTDGRHIGEHGEISKWLKEQMQKLTFILGKEIVYQLRLSDLRTFNETPKVVFACYDNVSEAEYFLHLVADEEVAIRGLGPCSAYWVSQLACLGASMSSGFMFCGPISMGVEWVAKNYVFPKLNEPLWKKACLGDEE